jgi:hypothetical protein
MARFRKLIKGQGVFDSEMRETGRGTIQELYKYRNTFNMVTVQQLNKYVAAENHIIKCW